MKIRLALLDNDTVYLNRLVSAFTTKFADKFEIHSFTNETSAVAELEKSKIDVFLVSDYFEIDETQIPSRCNYAYLVDTADIETVHGRMAICKFQKAELIYKRILSMFAEKTTIVTSSAANDESGKVVAFIAASGGTGSTVAAAAYASNMAKRGKKVIYLNLEMLGDSDALFHGEGEGNFGDIIYALKSKKSNLYLKIESAVKTDTESGVHYFSATPHALDMMELKLDEIMTLLAELKNMCGYEYIVLDVDFKFDNSMIDMLRRCTNIVLVTDGSVTANSKILRMLSALDIIEQKMEDKMSYKMSILYNRFSSQTSSTIEGIEISELGGIKRFEGYTVEQLIRQISDMNVFDSLA